MKRVALLFVVSLLLSSLGHAAPAAQLSLSTAQCAVASPDFLAGSPTLFLSSSPQAAAQTNCELNCLNQEKACRGTCGGPQCASLCASQYFDCLCRCDTTYC